MHTVFFCELRSDLSSIILGSSCTYPNAPRVNHVVVLKTVIFYNNIIIICVLHKKQPTIVMHLHSVTNSTSLWECSDKTASDHRLHEVAKFTSSKIGIRTVWHIK